MEAARTLRGVRFKHRGRDGGGVDCAGLLVLTHRAAGVSVVDDLRYPVEPGFDRLHDTIERNLDPVPNPGLDGDVVLFRLHLPHCGIVDGTGFWHVLRNRCVLWTDLRGVFRRAVVGYYGVR